jgi:hypothetical protein
MFVRSLEAGGGDTLAAPERARRRGKSSSLNINKIIRYVMLLARSFRHKFLKTAVYPSSSKSRCGDR